ncbi:MAG TPA: hypothetical protein VFI46_01065 [Jiangellaceae bacterium]|nr:hypothetical protein [Jiangellaceae bacterium]
MTTRLAKHLAEALTVTVALFGSRGLFEAYGFTVAEDRLWQPELNRRVVTPSPRSPFGDRRRAGHGAAMSPSSAGGLNPPAPTVTQADATCAR